MGGEYSRLKETQREMPGGAAVIPPALPCEWTHRTHEK